MKKTGDDTFKVANDETSFSSRGNLSKNDVQALDWNKAAEIANASSVTDIDPTPPSSVPARHQTLPEIRHEVEDDSEASPPAHHKKNRSYGISVEAQHSVLSDPVHQPFRETHAIITHYRAPSCGSVQSGDPLSPATHSNSGRRTHTTSLESIDVSPGVLSSESGLGKTDASETVTENPEVSGVQQQQVSVGSGFYVVGDSVSER